MVKISLVGFGSHVQKNILRAIRRLSNLELSTVYVRDPLKYAELAETWGVDVESTNNLTACSDSWVYISTPIATHYEIAYTLLKAGKNVICEKPLTDSLEKTIELYNYADDNGLILQEVCMYRYHKQYSDLCSQISENTDRAVAFKARFTIPHLDKDNIRYQKSLGGGALLDVAFYPISIAVNLFGKPKSVQSVLHSKAGYEVDLFGATILNYEDFYCLAEWGIGLPYSNEAIFLTDNTEYHYDRIFSKPETFESKVKVRYASNHEEIAIGRDDQFANFLDSVINGAFPDSAVTESIEVSKIMREVHEYFAIR